MMELKDTVGGMLSDDWKERLKAEYYQLAIRYEKLKDAITRLCESKGDPELLHALSCQFAYMTGYVEVLKERASAAGIQL